MHELSLAGAIVNTAVKHAAGGRVTVVTLRVGRAAPGRAGLAGVLLRVRRARHASARARGSSRSSCPALPALRGVRARVGDRLPGLPLPELRGGAASRCAAGNEFEVESIEVEEAGMHRTKVRVVEDALDANNTIARANRDDFDRAGVTVVNLMSAPGAGKTTLLERVAAGASTACASACSRATCRAAWTPTGSRSARPGHAAQHRPGLRRRVPPRREHGPLGAARRCRSTDSTCS